MTDRKATRIDDSRRFRPLDEMAPFGSARMCPEIGIFHAVAPQERWRAIADLAGPEPVRVPVI